MPSSTFRILKRHGRLILAETANPMDGAGYSVIDENSKTKWHGDNITEAQRQFEQMTAAECHGIIASDP